MHKTFIEALFFSPLVVFAIHIFRNGFVVSTVLRKNPLWWLLIVTSFDALNTWILLKAFAESVDSLRPLIDTGVVSVECFFIVLTYGFGGRFGRSL